MKKKIALVLILVLTLTFVFTGCVELNVDRDNALIVSNIEYKGLTATVTKGDLKSFFNTQGYILVNYYGMSVEDAYNYCAKSLAQSELLRLKALDELCKEKGIDPKTIKVFDKGAVNKVEGSFANIFNNLLYIDEKIKVIENYNEQFDELIKSYLEEIEKENATDEDEDEEEEEEDKDEDEDEEIPEIRAERGEEDKEDDFKPVADDKLTEDEKAEKVKKLEETLRFEEKWEKDTHTDDENEAYDRLKKQLTKVKKTFEDIFEDTVNSMLTDHYKRTASAVSDEVVNSYYDSKKQEIIDANKEKFEKKNTDGKIIFAENDYKSSLGGSNTIYHNINSNGDGKDSSVGYGYTLNILMKFDAVSTEAYAKQKEIYNVDGKISDWEKGQLQALAMQYASKITVNISNPNYKADGKCVCGLTGKQINEKNEDGSYKYKDKYGYHNCRSYEGTDKTDSEKANCELKPFGYDVGDSYSFLTPDEIELIKNGYDVPIVTVLKMINYDLKKVNAEYDDKLVGVTDEVEKLEIEFNRQVALREVFIQWIYKVNDDPGMFSSENSNGYLVSKNGESGYVEEYTDHARKLMGGTKEGDKYKYSYNHYVDTQNQHFVGKYYVDGAIDDGASTLNDFKNMIAVTEYGVHVIMICDMPGFYADKEQILMDDAIVSYGRDSYVTLRKSLIDSIRTTLENDKYGNITNELIKDADKYIKTNTEVYKNLYKDK